NAEHKRIVRRYYEDVLQQHNLAALDDIFAPDFVGHSTAYGTYALTDMRRDIGRGRATMPDDETIIEEQLAEGDCVVTRWRYRWRQDQSVFGEPPSTEWIAMEGVHIDRLRSRRIVERWEIKDFWGVVTRMGGKISFSDEAPPQAQTQGSL